MRSCARLLYVYDCCYEWCRWEGARHRFLQAIALCGWFFCQQNQMWNWCEGDVKKRFLHANKSYYKTHNHHKWCKFANYLHLSQFAGNSNLLSCPLPSLNQHQPAVCLQNVPAKVRSLAGWFKPENAFPIKACTGPFCSHSFLIIARPDDASWRICAHQKLQPQAFNAIKASDGKRRRKNNPQNRFIPEKRSTSDPHTIDRS